MLCRRDIFRGAGSWRVPLRLLARRFGESVLSLIDPGGRVRHEAGMLVRSPRRPYPDGGGLVGRMVLHPYPADPATCGSVFR